MRRFIVLLFLFLLVPVFSSCQLPSSRCDTLHIPIVDCASLTEDGSASDSRGAPADSFVSADLRTSPPAAMIETASPPKPPGFRWGRAVFESFTFFAIEQAYVVHEDYRWVVIENGIPFNHYWRDYKQSLSTWVHSGWNDGDPSLYSYVGHPIQGAMTEFIQIQNDPRGAALELSNSRPYWHSRFRAFLWNAVYSTLWNIGPLSELTFEKYGTKARPPWNQDGTWPCTHKPCFTGVGQVDLVLTPIGGTGWVLGEDFLDKEVARRVEGSTRNVFFIDATRCALNPIRGGANILHGRRPWYRASRDASQVYFSHQYQKHASRVHSATSQTP